MKRTRKQALTRMLAAYNAGTLGASEPQSDGSCMYQRGERTCIVGCMFNQAQLDSIKAKKLNKQPIAVVVEKIGLKNIEYVTGLDFYELKHLQKLHDEQADHGVAKAKKSTKLYKYLVRQLSKFN